MTSVLSSWQRLATTGAGRWLFARLVCLRSPYFATIRPRLATLEPWKCVVLLAKRRAVTNHLGTVHAIAIANAFELAAGLMMEASCPSAMRWIPRGMAIEYLKKATSSLRIEAGASGLEGPARQDIPVQCAAFDEAGVLVCRATIQMYVSPREGRKSA